MEAWKITIGILQSEADAEVKLFAATTLRGKVCSHTGFIASSELMLVDYLWSATTAWRSFAIPSRSAFTASKAVCYWRPTDTYPVMCMFGDFGNTDDRLERCGASSCFNSGEWCRQSCMHSRFPQSSSWRSHRRAKNQYDSMWTELHHSTNFPIGVGSARLYQYHNLMRHTRKKSYLKEHKSYWVIMLVVLFNS